MLSIKLLSINNKVDSVQQMSRLLIISEIEPFSPHYILVLEPTCSQFLSGNQSSAWIARGCLSGYIIHRFLGQIANAATSRKGLTVCDLFVLFILVRPNFFILLLYLVFDLRWFDYKLKNEDYTIQGLHIGVQLLTALMVW